MILHFNSKLTVSYINTYNNNNNNNNNNNILQYSTTAPWRELSWAVLLYTLLRG